MAKENEGKSVRKLLVGAATYSHLGLTFAGAVALFFFIGYWLDGKWGTEPLFAIIGAFLGAVGGFINLIRVLNQLQKREDGGQGSP